MIIFKKTPDYIHQIVCQMINIESGLNYFINGKYNSGQKCSSCITEWNDTKIEIRALKGIINIFLNISETFEFIKAISAEYFKMLLEYQIEIQLITVETVTEHTIIYNEKQIDNCIWINPSNIFRDFWKLISVQIYDICSDKKNMNTDTMFISDHVIMFDNDNILDIEHGESIPNIYINNIRLFKNCITVIMNSNCKSPIHFYNKYDIYHCLYQITRIADTNKIKDVVEFKDLTLLKNIIFPKFCALCEKKLFGEIYIYLPSKFSFNNAVFICPFCSFIPVKRKLKSSIIVKVQHPLSIHQYIDENFDDNIKKAILHRLSEATDFKGLEDLNGMLIITDINKIKINDIKRYQYDSRVVYKLE